MAKFSVIIRNIAFSTIILFTCAIAMSCQNSIDEMLKDYNKKNFATASTTVYTAEQSEDTESLSPGDFGFTSSKMLRDEYFVWEDSTLNLAAPYNCVAYVWQMYDPENENILVEPVTMSGTSSRLYVLYVPDSNLEYGHTYKLKLTVKSTAGEIFVDTCGIIVYRHYNYGETDTIQTSSSPEDDKKTGG